MDSIGFLDVGGGHSKDEFDCDEESTEDVECPTIRVSKQEKQLLHMP